MPMRQRSYSESVSAASWCSYERTKAAAEPRRSISHGLTGGRNATGEQQQQQQQFWLNHTALGGYFRPRASQNNGPDTQASRFGWTCIEETISNVSSSMVINMSGLVFLCQKISNFRLCDAKFTSRRRYWTQLRVLKFLLLKSPIKTKQSNEGNVSPSK